MNSRYLPSKGFVLLVCIVIFIAGTVYHVFGPLEDEYESFGTRYYREGMYEKAARMYVTAAEKATGPQDKSRCYRSVANSYIKMEKFGQSLDYVLEALRYDKGSKATYRILSYVALGVNYTDYGSLIEVYNKAYRIEGTGKGELADIVRKSILKIPAPELEGHLGAFDAGLLEEVMAEDPVLPFGQYREGWSMGRHAGFMVMNKAGKEGGGFVLELKTIFPEDFYPAKVTMKVNETSQEVVLPARADKKIDLPLAPGVNTVLLTIDKTVVPSEIGPSKDTRELGMMSKVIMQ